MGKHKHFKVQDFLNFSFEAEILAVPKIRKKWISIVQEKYGKTPTFQIYGFLKYFGWSINPYNSLNMGKVNSHNTGKVWESMYTKTQTLQIYEFLKYFSGEAEIHIIPKTWQKWIPIVREKYVKTNISKWRVS